MYTNSKQGRLPCPGLPHAGEHTYQNNLPPLLSTPRNIFLFLIFLCLRLFPLSLTFNPLLSGGSHLCSMAEQWNPRGCLSCLGLDCWAPTMCSGRLAYNMPPLCNALIHRGTICPPPICSCIQHVTLGPLQRSHIHPNTQCSVIVQRATNEANYPKEPRAVVGDALTYIPVWPDCSFGQPT